MFEDEKEEPVSVMVVNNVGQHYDMNNIPGHVRKHLIESGKISIDKFVNVDNMPGYKLKQIRDSFIAGLGMEKEEAPSIDINKLEVGSLVEYKNIVTEVKEINLEKSIIRIDIKGMKKGWVNIKKCKPVALKEVDGDEE